MSVKCPGCGKIIVEHYSSAMCTDCRAVWPLSFIREKYPECCSIGNDDPCATITNAVTDLLSSGSPEKHLEACKRIRDAAVKMIDRYKPQK